MEPIIWIHPNLQMLPHSPSYVKVSHIPSSSNAFTCSLNPILPVFYLDLALSIILLFSWVYSTSFSTGSISSAEIYIKLKKKIKPPSMESMRNQGPKLLCSEIHPHICLKAMASPRLLLAYAREFTSESCGTPLMVDFSFRTPSWLC